MPRSAAMIVGQPNPVVSGVHDCMPVMLMAEDYDRWLGPDTAPTADELRAMLRAYDAALMDAGSLLSGFVGVPTFHTAHLLFAGLL